MEKPKSYCDVVKHFEPTNVHKIYHDTSYGFPIDNDDELFERLILEINQAGLSWTTILNKQVHFKKAFHQFNIKKVATIYNAGVVLQLQKDFGSFKNWLDEHHPLTKEAWVKIFKKTFKFTGGEIVNEFLMSTGYLDGSHIIDCPVYHHVVQSNPPWMIKK